MLGYIAIANTVAGSDAPRGGGGDVDAGGHGVVNGGGSELSLGTGGGSGTHADGLERMTVASAG
jgi:hypothetical protein